MTDKQRKHALKKLRKKQVKQKLKNCVTTISKTESIVIYSFSFVTSYLLHVGKLDIFIFSLQYFIALLAILYIFRHSTNIGIDDILFDSKDDGSLCDGFDDCSGDL